MVVIHAGFCLVASAVAFAVYAWLPISDRMPGPVLAYFVAVDFMIGPLGVLAGGFGVRLVPTRAGRPRNPGRAVLASRGS